MTPLPSGNGSPNGTTSSGAPFAGAAQRATERTSQISASSRLLVFTSLSGNQCLSSGPQDRLQSVPPHAVPNLCCVLHATSEEGRMLCQFPSHRQRSSRPGFRRSCACRKRKRQWVKDGNRPVLGLACFRDLFPFHESL